jgi:hypothetical protein
MRRHTAFALLLFVAAPALAHGPHAPDPPAKPAAPKEDPCAVLSEAMVRAALSLPAATALKGEREEGRPACVYRWDKPDRAAIQERNTKRMIEEGQLALEAERDEKDQPARERMEPLEGEVRLMLPPTRFASKKKAQEAFASSLKRMARGHVVDLEGQAFLNQASFEPVKGVGDLAAWSGQRSELGFVKGERVYWLVVKGAAGADDNKTLAVALAKRLAATR